MTNTRQRGAKRQADDGEKQPKRTRRKLRGSLESLPSMPVDILIEIMSYLMPSDILHLARTTKTFRTFLMAHSSNHIWRAARMNVALGFPDCPEHLSEPAYAHLAFDTYCHNCLKNNVKTVFWALGVRYCPSCRGQLLVKCKLSTVFCELAETLIVPYSHDRTTNCHWHLRKHYATDVQEKYLAMDTEEAQQHQGKVQSIIEWADECELWHSDVAICREVEISECRSKRLHAIVEKLKELGWADELARIAPSYKELSDYNPVKDPKEFTERIWQNMQKGVVQHMQSIKQRRLDRERVGVLKRRCQGFAKVYRKWHKTQADRSALPRPIDLIMRRPEIREVIDKEGDVAVTFRDFKVFKKHFAAWAEEWAEDCRKQLREIVLASPEFKDKIPEGTDPLSLASVAFTCSDCEALFAEGGKGQFPALYPDVLQHECLWTPVSSYSHEGKSLVERAALAASDRLGYTFTRGTWSCRSLRIDLWHRRLVEIIKMCGKDPMSVTREEMDAVETRFYCDFCEQECAWKRREVFMWWNTLAHHNNHDRGNETRDTEDVSLPLEWRTITNPEELALVTKLGARVEEFLKDPTNWITKVEGYHCYHCASGAKDCFELMFHLKEKHCIALDKTTLEDYYLTPGAITLLEHPVVLYPPWAFRMGLLKEEDDSEGWKTIKDGRAGVHNFKSPIGTLYKSLV